MADQHVLHQRLKRRGESLDRIHLFCHQFVFQKNVAQQLARRGVADRAVVGQFIELADIVQDRAGHQ